MRLKEKQVRKLAKKSRHRWAHHVAVLTLGNKVVAVGYNRGEMHAEAMALRKMRMAGGNTRPDCLYSYRIRRDGRLGASRPCSDCFVALLAADVHYVYYYDYNGQQYRMVLPR